ncbi:MAG TPA: divalent-cation tolerance protein CutA [Deltaproteobacteria bacterium]|nr:divalent-cation tolerance protein CutA [Deltaproteobacteria bacterium]
MEGYFVVMTTASGVDEAAAIAKAVVDEGLAACCNIVSGVRSIYRWKGEICDEAEVLCVMKTRGGLVEELTARIRELHGYEVPEVVALEIASGNGDYLRWIDECTSRTGLA